MSLKDNRFLHDLAHRYIILELTIKTLELDRTSIGHLKMNEEFNAWFLYHIERLHHEFAHVNDTLKKNRWRITKGFDAQEGFSEYIITGPSSSSSHSRNYANYALRNQVSEEVKKCLGFQVRGDLYKKNNE